MGLLVDRLAQLYNCVIFCVKLSRRLKHVFRRRNKIKKKKQNLVFP